MRFGEIEFNIFGERWSVPDCPEIVVVSNINDNGKPIGIRRAGENWHSDMSLHRAATARDDPLCDRDTRTLRPAARRHRIRQQRCQQLPA